MTRYIITSIDQQAFFYYWRRPYNGEAVFGPRELEAARFESMTEAQLEIFVLTAKDPAAGPLNLIVCPIKSTAYTKDLHQPELL
jgi:hypothetical protein